MLARLLPILTVLVAAAAPAHASGPKKPRIAVLEIKSVDQESAVAAQLLAEVILTDLAKTGRYEVIGASDIANMLGFEKQKQLLGCSDENSCLAEIGGALGVQWLITGSLGRLGSFKRIDLRLVDTRKARVAAREGTEIESDNDLIKWVRRVTPKLTREIAAPKGQAAAVPPPTIEEEADSGGPRILPPVLVGAGAVAVGAGLYLGYSALDFNDAKTTLAYDDALHARDAAERKMIVGGALVAAGATAAIAGVALWIFGGEETAPVASIGPDGVYLALSGSF